jgi:hypothetical protein
MCHFLHAYTPKTKLVFEGVWTVTHKFCFRCVGMQKMTHTVCSFLEMSISSPSMCSSSRFILCVCDYSIRSNWGRSWDWKFKRAKDMLVTTSPGTFTCSQFNPILKAGNIYEYQSAPLLHHHTTIFVTTSKGELIENSTRNPCSSNLFRELPGLIFV